MDNKWEIIFGFTVKNCNFANNEYKNSYFLLSADKFSKRNFALRYEYSYLSGPDFRAYS